MDRLEGGPVSLYSIRLSVAVTSAILLGGDAQTLFEDITEVWDVLYTAFLGYAINLHIRTNQELFCVFYPEIGNVLVGSDTQDIPKNLMKIGGAEIGLAG